MGVLGSNMNEKARIQYLRINEEAWKPCEELGKVYVEAGKAQDKAMKAYVEARRAYMEAKKAYEEIEKVAWEAYQEATIEVLYGTHKIEG